MESTRESLQEWKYCSTLYWNHVLHQFEWTLAWHKSTDDRTQSQEAFNRILDDIWTELLDPTQSRFKSVDNLLDSVWRICEVDDNCLEDLLTRLFAHFWKQYVESNSLTQFLDISKIICNLDSKSRRKYMDYVWLHFSKIVEHDPKLPIVQVLEESVSMGVKWMSSPSERYFWTLHRYLFARNMDVASNAIDLFIQIMEKYVQSLYPISFSSWKTIETYINNDGNYESLEKSLTEFVSRFCSDLPSKIVVDHSNRKQMTLILENIHKVVVYLGRILVSSETLLDVVASVLESTTDMDKSVLECRTILCGSLNNLIQHLINLDASDSLVRKIIPRWFRHMNMMGKTFSERMGLLDRPVLSTFFQQKGDVAELSSRYWMSADEKNEFALRHEKTGEALKREIENVLQMYKLRPRLVSALLDESWIQCLDPKSKYTREIRSKALNVLFKILKYHPAIDSECIHVLDGLHRNYLHPQVVHALESQAELGYDQWCHLFPAMVLVLNILVGAEWEIRTWMEYFDMYGVSSLQFRSGSTFCQREIGYRFVFNVFQWTDCRSDDQLREELVKTWMFLLLENDSTLQIEFSDLVLGTISNIHNPNPVLFDTLQHRLDSLARFLSTQNSFQFGEFLHQVIPHFQKVSSHRIDHQQYFHNVIRIFLKHIPEILCHFHRKDSITDLILGLENENIHSLIGEMLVSLEGLDYTKPSVKREVEKICNFIGKTSSSIPTLHVLDIGNRGFIQFVMEKLCRFLGSSSFLSEYLVLCRIWISKQKLGRMSKNWVETIVWMLDLAMCHFHSQHCTTVYLECFKIFSHMLFMSMNTENNSIHAQILQWARDIYRASLDLTISDHDLVLRQIFWRAVFKSTHPAMRAITVSCPHNPMEDKTFRRLNPRIYYDRILAMGK